jgi:hypothetical protein
MSCDGFVCKLTMVAFLFLPIQGLLAERPQSFGDIYAEKGPPQEKAVFETKRVIIWKYGSEHVVFKDGIVVEVRRTESEQMTKIALKKEAAIEEEPLEAEKRQERLRITRERMKEHKRIPGVGPKEDLNEQDVAGMLSAFVAAGEKEEAKTAPGAMGSPLGSEFAPPPIDSIQ